MKQHLHANISILAKVIMAFWVSLEQYTPEQNSTTESNDDNVVDDNVVKWAVNSAVVDEIRSILPPELIKSTDRNALVSEVSKCFENLKLNDLVCAVYKKSRHLLRSYTVDSIENLVRNCYGSRGTNTIVDMMVNTN